MKNKLSDLTDHLFAQIERLADEDLSVENIETEVKRAGAMVSIADRVIASGHLQLDAARLLAKDAQAGANMPLMIKYAGAKK